MLVLARKVGQSLIIGDSIRVTVLAVQDGQIRVGIAAPPNVKINREEVQKRLAQQQGLSNPGN